MTKIPYSNLKKIKQEKTRLRKEMGLSAISRDVLLSGKSSVDAQNGIFTLSEFSANFASNELAKRSTQFKKHSPLINLLLTMLFTFIFTEMKSRFSRSKNA